MVQESTAEEQSSFLIACLKKRHYGHEQLKYLVFRSRLRFAYEDVLRIKSEQYGSTTFFSIKKVMPQTPNKPPQTLGMPTFSGPLNPSRDTHVDPHETLMIMIVSFIIKEIYMEGAWPYV
ncbi:hypothetical protein KIW84_040868 [Lathyrus oleraceus]|uniref:Uncharacterized protein n=1 Tax=Pisum sativum TaxID=3888 RepID=A0A9D5ARD7_PEA|nr:hypothetical protein KIW84_040868 [Pisum sativum]